MPVRSTRRGFLVGCSTAIASLAGSRFNSLAFAQGAGRRSTTRFSSCSSCAAARTG